jgi:beta-carotene hydroxylase
MLKNRADLRTLAFMAVTTALLIVQWSRPTFSWILFSLAMAMAISVSTMVHNHNHLPMWRSRILNVLTDCWLTLFYGFPIFVWIPTHNQNHHKLNNREGDYTITWRLTEKNHLGMLLAYPTVSGLYQQASIAKYLQRNWQVKRSRFFYHLTQYAVLGAFLAVALFVDWKKALLYIFLPQQFAMFTVLIFNFLQHVHADEESEWNHSRNFTGPVVNGFLFNNGFHTAHHWRAATHWSETPAVHRSIESRIEPALNERSMLWYILRTYLLAPLVPRFRSHSMRLDRISAAATNEA